MAGTDPQQITPSPERVALVSETVTAMRRSGIREMMDLAARRPDVLHLEIGEPDFPTPSHVLDTAMECMRGGLVKYTLSRGIATLREAIADKLRVRNGIDATTDEVVVTTGGTTALLEAMLVMLRPDDGVLIPDPGWPAFEMIVTLLHGRPLRYRLDRNAGYRPDLDHVASLAGEARFLVLNSPSNPTGAILDRAELEAMLALAERHGLVVVSDEVYEDVVFEGEHVSPASLGSDVPVVSVFSFSKGYAMTGFRVGYLVGPPGFAEAVVKAQEAVVACPSFVGQHAALAALTGPQDCLAEMREEYRRRRDGAVTLLRDAEMLLSVPRGTFYVMADVTRAGLDTHAIAKRLLVEHGVAVAPGETFGDEGVGAVRLSLASQPAVIEEGIRRMAAALTSGPIA